MVLRGNLRVLRSSNSSNQTAVKDPVISGSCHQSQQTCSRHGWQSQAAEHTLSLKSQPSSSALPGADGLKLLKRSLVTYHGTKAPKKSCDEVLQLHKTGIEKRESKEPVPDASWSCTMSLVQGTTSNARGEAWQGSSTGKRGWWRQMGRYREMKRRMLGIPIKKIQRLLCHFRQAVVRSAFPLTNTKLLSLAKPTCWHHMQLGLEVNQFVKLPSPGALSQNNWYSYHYRKL